MVITFGGLAPNGILSTILADLNLAVWYSITIIMYIDTEKNLVDDRKAYRQIFRICSKL